MYSRETWQVCSAGLEGVHKLACGTGTVGVCIEAGFANVVDGKRAYGFLQYPFSCGCISKPYMVLWQVPPLGRQEERTVVRFRV